MKDTKLKIEIIPGNRLCKSCNKVYKLILHERKCPYCQSKDFDLVSGKEFIIKEVIAY